jgi:hypothetical protein
LNWCLFAVMELIPPGNIGVAASQKISTRPPDVNPGAEKGGWIAGGRPAAGFDFRRQIP